MVAFVRHAGRQMAHLAVPALLALLGLCIVPVEQGFASQTLDVMMPPNRFIHPFDGTVVVMKLPHKAGSPMLSLSHHESGTCAVWLPRIGDPDITAALYECLTVVEVANCNGATDINTPAVRTRTPLAQQASYDRSCSSGNWGWAYNAVRSEPLGSGLN